MFSRKLVFVSALVALSMTVLPGLAQVRNFDTEYPDGAVHSLIERGVLPQKSTNTGYPSLKGRVLHSSDNDVYTKKAKKLKVRHTMSRRSDDTLQGKTIQIDIGMGGAHAY